MPELVPALDRLAGQLPSPEAGTLLTMAAVRPFFSGCTQTGRDGTLLRNYDYAPEHCEGTIVSSHFLRPVIGMREAGWGLLDGMNDAGLAVSLTFGGRYVHGRGFALPLVLRPSAGDLPDCRRGAGQTAHDTHRDSAERHPRRPGPDRSWKHSFDAFSPGTLTVTLGLPDEGSDDS